MKQSILKTKSFLLASEVVAFCGKYSHAKNFIFTNQLIRCGTSIGACVSEAGAAQSRRDFITKMAIASKEARETLYWLRLIQSTTEHSEECELLIASTEEVIKLLTATIKTAQQNERNNH